MPGQPHSQPLWFCWVKGICPFICKLPPALLAEWLGSCSCHCSNTELEWTLNRSQHRKLTLEKKILPPLLLRFKLTTFLSQVQHSTNKLSPLHGRDAGKCKPLWPPHGQYALLPDHRWAFSLQPAQDFHWTLDPNLSDSYFYIVPLVVTVFCVWICWLGDALSPVNHKGLYQGWKQTSIYFLVIPPTCH